MNLPGEGGPADPNGELYHMIRNVKSRLELSKYNE